MGWKGLRGDEENASYVRLHTAVTHDKGREGMGGGRRGYNNTAVHTCTLTAPWIVCKEDSCSSF